MKNVFMEDLVDALVHGELFYPGGMPLIRGGADQDIAYDGDPSLFTNNDAKARNRPGTIIRYLDKEYMYVQYNSAGATVPLVGAPAYLVGLSAVQVSALYSESQSGTINDVVGMIGNVITNLYYGWIQISGNFVGAIDTSGAIAKGDQLIGATDENTTGRVALNTAPTNKCIGYAYTATAGNKANFFLVLRS
jgi:hypothetical protein